MVDPPLHAAAIATCAGSAAATTPAAAAAALTWGLTLHAAPHVLRNLVALNQHLPPPGAAGVAVVAPSTRAACELAQELFTAQGRYVGLVRTRSRPAAHLDLRAVGSLAAAAAAAAASDDVASAQKQWAGALARAEVVSNKVRGEWTGVSMARYRRLLDLAAAADGATPTSSSETSTSGVVGLGMPLIVAHGWKRVRTSTDFTDLWSGLQEQGRTCSMARNSQVVSGARPRARSSRVNYEPNPELAGAALELSRRHWFRIQHDVVSHQTLIPGASEFADCVEVAVREVLEFVLSDPLTADLVPSPTLQRLIGLSRACEDMPARRPEAARAWASELQRLRGRSVTFLRKTGDGTPYELAPTAATVSAACAALLSPTAAESGDLTSSGADDDVTFESLKKLGFSVKLSEGLYSENMLMDNSSGGVKHRYNVDITSPSRAHRMHLELEMEKSHPSAKVAYEAPDVAIPSPPGLAVLPADGGRWIADAAFHHGLMLSSLVADPGSAASAHNNMAAAPAPESAVLGYDWQYVPANVREQRRRAHAAVGALQVLAASPSTRWLATFVLPRVPRARCEPSAVYRAVRHDPELVQQAAALGWPVPQTLSPAWFLRHPATSARILSASAAFSLWRENA